MKSRSHGAVADAPPSNVDAILPSGSRSGAMISIDPPGLHGEWHPPVDPATWMPPEDDLRPMIISSDLEETS